MKHLYSRAGLMQLFSARPPTAAEEAKRFVSDRLRGRVQKGIQ
jgi:hypothetical protein